VAEEAPESFGHCEECGEPLLPRHFIGVCDFCADLMPYAERMRIRAANRAPDGSGAAGRLEKLGALRFRFNLWTVPGVAELLSAREALRHFGPDELPKSLA
jgi:hypothetical protein